MDELKQTFKLTYAYGLHARPCAALVSLVKPFSSKVKLVNGSEKADTHSILEMLFMGIQSGDVTFEAEGEDAEKVLQKIGEFINMLNTEKHW